MNNLGPKWIPTALGPQNTSMQIPYLKNVKVWTKLDNFLSIFLFHAHTWNLGSQSGRNSFCSQIIPKNHLKLLAFWATFQRKISYNYLGTKWMPIALGHQITSLIVYAVLNTWKIDVRQIFIFFGGPRIWFFVWIPIFKDF